MADLSPLISFTAGTPAVADEVNQNFAAIRAHVNGANIGTKNIESTLLSRSGGPILNLTQLTENQIAFNVENSQSNTAVSIAQLAALAAGKSILKLSETVAQTQGDAQLFLSLQSSSTIPALLVKHGGTETFKLTKNYLSLETLLKPPVRTTSQRNAISSPEEGSVIYNSTTEDINIKRANEWAPIGCPVGSLIMYAGPTAPEGWLLCIGSAVPNGSGTIQGITSDFSKLYAVIGANLPDLRGRIPLGKDNMGGSSANRVTNVQADSLLGTEGSETIAETSLPMHTHIYYESYWSETASGANYSPYETIRNSPLNQGAGFTEPGSGNPRHGVYEKTETFTSSTNNGWNSVVASNLAGNAHMPPYQTFNYIIKY